MDFFEWPFVVPIPFSVSPATFGLSLVWESSLVTGMPAQIHLVLLGLLYSSLQLPMRASSMEDEYIYIYIYYIRVCVKDC